MLTILIIFLSLISCHSQNKPMDSNKKTTYNVNKTDEEWRNILTDEEYRILREKGTERPHTGKYNLHFEKGNYNCAACGQTLFDSNTKFDAHCGWPSFDDALEGTITYVEDRSLGMVRTEILCSNCGSHLGHVFKDGPTDTGLRYCVNSVSLDFESKTKQNSED
ncbi:peptide-methionine (R)-S-oxide reductase [Mangrovimonas spongiae]|uniref:peptide-methionine (R)-S-oxide reductase n=2 Tax=Mangrovimonas spongiae TaxID=2494697 RepID=A0A428JVV5_9FLAO|nr:peptide-methionine (R)-S-oxide reductase [Mangrovimonas spongiae]